MAIGDSSSSEISPVSQESIDHINDVVKSFKRLVDLLEAERAELKKEKDNIRNKLRRGGKNKTKEGLRIRQIVVKAQADELLLSAGPGRSSLRQNLNDFLKSASNILADVMKRELEKKPVPGEAVPYDANIMLCT